MRRLLLPALAVLLLTGLGARRWGGHGHTTAAAAAVDALPAEMPAFFREARAQLVYLNPEPDRWRDRAESGHDPALDGVGTPEHFLDVELIPADRQASFLAAHDRYAFADSLRTINVRVQIAGLAPFAILELTQRLRLGFRAWRRTESAAERHAIEIRIINDAGVLGHYVADVSNPAHTSIHYNGWVGPNPNGYATDNRFHSRFEGAFVQARITLADLTPLVPREPRVFDALRPAVLAHFMESNALVEPLYAQDKRTPFGADNADPAAKQFAASRLAAGARMMRDLWWTAWVTSETP